MQNPYSVLGVARNADADAIKKAYKKLARKYHPDVSKEPGADARFKEINAAYDVLGDPEKRKNFDRFGEASTRTGFNPNQAGFGGFGGFGGGSPGGAGFGGANNMEDILESLFGAGGGGARPRTGRDQAVRISIEPLVAFTGGQRVLPINRPDGSVERLSVRIPAGVSDRAKLRLKGQGLPPAGGGPCGDLIVTVLVPEHPLLRRVDDDLEMDLPVTVLEAIQGTAVTVPTPGGEVKVNIPAGVANGQRLRLRGKGLQTSPPGHLYLVIRPTVPTSTDPTVIQAAERIEEAYPSPVRANLKL